MNHRSEIRMQVSCVLRSSLFDYVRCIHIFALGGAELRLIAMFPWHRIPIFFLRRLFIKMYTSSLEHFVDVLAPHTYRVIFFFYILYRNQHSSILSRSFIFNNLEALRCIYSSLNSLDICIVSDTTNMILLYTIRY